MQQKQCHIIYISVRVGVKVLEDFIGKATLSSFINVIRTASDTLWLLKFYQPNLNAYRICDFRVPFRNYNNAPTRRLEHNIWTELMRSHNNVFVINNSEIYVRTFWSTIQITGPIKLNFKRILVTSELYKLRMFKIFSYRPIATVHTICRKTRWH